MKFKKFLAGAMVGTMVLASVTGVSAATVTVTNEAWWDAWTPTFEIANGETLELKVDLTVSGTAVYQNLNAVFVNVATDGATTPAEIDGYAEYVVLRSDNYGWGDYYATTTYTGTDYLYNEDITDYSTIMTGATYDITITRNGTTINYDYVITEADGETQLNCGYEIVIADLADTDSAYVFFTGDAGATFTITYGIEINADDTIGLVVGNTTTLDVTYVPSSLEASVEFTSSDENVATVDSTGTITGVAEGSAVITATSGDYSDTVNVNVSESENLITGVTAVASSTELTVGDAATITPSYVAADSTAVTTENNYSYSYEVTSGTDVISVDSNGTVTALAAGSGTVTVTVTCESGTFTTTVDFTVAEAESEEASESTDSSSDSSDDSSSEEAETESEETVTTVEESETMTIESFWTSFTSGYEVTEDGLTLTLTTTNNGSSNWENVIWVLYSSDSGYLCTSGADSDAATEDNYVEYYVGRADAYGWDGASAVGTATLEATYSDDFDWETWLAATQAGAEVTITATLDGDGNAVVTLECADMSYTVTVPVNADSTIYLALTGENCTLSDLTVNGESANFPILVQTAVTTDNTETTDTETETTSTSDGTGSTTTTTTTTTTTSTGGANTGDASPIIPIAVAVLGCAVVVVASKKRMA